LDPGERRFTLGTPTDRRIMALALPAIATVAAEPLYDLTDAAILAHIGTTALAGAVVATSILLLISAVFIFLMFATTAAVSRLLAEGRPADAVRQGVSGSWFGLAAGTAIAAVTVWFVSPLCALWGTTGATAEAAEAYLRISLLGIPAMLVTLAATGYLRGTGTTTVPMWIAFGSVAVNLALEVITVFGLGWGVEASAASTVVAKWLAAGWSIRYLIVAARQHRVTLWPDRTEIGGVGRRGTPLFVRTLALRGTVSVAAGLVAHLGPAELAGFGIAFAIWSFLAFCADGLEVAGQVLVAGELGAGDAAAARAMAARILTLAAGLGVVLCVVLLAVRTVVADGFSPDAQVTALAAAGLLWVAATQPVNAVVFALDGILVGAGDLWASAVIMAGAAAAALPVWWAFGDRSAGIWAGLLVFMAVRLVGMSVRWKFHRLDADR